MISKEDYIQGEVESAWEDPKFVNQVLYSWFEDNVKDLNQEEFKEYLIDLGWDRDVLNDWNICRCTNGITSITIGRIDINIKRDV